MGKEAIRQLFALHDCRLRLCACAHMLVCVLVCLFLVKRSGLREDGSTQVL